MSDSPALWRVWDQQRGADSSEPSRFPGWASSPMGQVMLAWPQLGLAVSAPVLHTQVLLCAQGCSFPPKLLPHLSDPGSLLADIPDLLQGCHLMLLRFLLSPEPCQSSPPPFPLPPALPRRAGTPQASPLIVFSLWQVERDETPTPCLRWLPNYFCIFSMSNYLRRDHSGDISPQESHLCPRRTGKQPQGAEKMPGIAGGG